jgi:hypothetical protein
LKRMARSLAPLALAALLAGCEDLPPAPELPNQPPTASFYFTPVAPIWAGQTAVAFSAINARDPDGQVVSYVWNFGDGTPEQTTTGPSTTHTFPDTAARCMSVTYGVLLSVVDDKGGRGAASQGVTVVEAPAPTAAECQPR